MSLLTKGLGSNLIITKGMGYYIGRVITRLLKLYSKVNTTLHIRSGNGC